MSPNLGPKNNKAKLRHYRPYMLPRITEAFPWVSAPAFLVRDNDRAYGPVFKSRVRAMGKREAEEDWSK